MRAPFRILLGCLVLALLPSFVFAEVRVRLTGASVFVNEQLVVSLKGARAQERAASVAASFRKLTEDSEIRIESIDKVFQIVDGDRVVLTATAAEAKAQKVSPEALINQWARRLRRALDAAPLTIENDRVRIPLGGKRTLKVGGFRAGGAKSESENGEVVTSSVSGGTLTLNGKSAGTAIVTVTAGDASKSVRVEVLPVAMRFPQTVNVNVTGDPASAELVRQAVEGALWTQLKSARDTSYTFRIPELRGVGSEQSYSVQVPVTAGSATAFDNSGNVTVNIKNEPIGFKAETVLWYCNYPENVRGPRNLFAAHLKRNEPARMLYHHINGSSAPMVMTVNLVNESNQEARVVIIPGDSPADRNPVRAGLVAADQLLRAWIRNNGEIVTIPPRSSLPLAMRRTAPEETMSGLAYLRLIGGPNQISVRTDAIEPPDGDARWNLGLKSSSPWRRVATQPLNYEGTARLKISDLVFPSPFKTETATYAVGGRHTFIRIGQKPIPRPNGEGLDGNFGVFYTIEAMLENNTNDASEIEVVFEASAGYSGALFAMGSEVMRTPLLQPKEESVILKYRLMPGERKPIELLTIPLSGSSYPSTIVIRPAGSGSGRPRKSS
jgi:hypothetical protein